jgi:plastocyanin
MKTILFSVILFAIVTAGYCTTWTITNSGFTFSPATITITVGDSVNFSVTSIHQPLEVSQATWNANGNTPLAGGFQTPFGGGLVLPAKLTVGTHYYVCSAHASMGMKGTIIVQNSTGIKENTAKTNFSVFPNPSNGKFQIEMVNPVFPENYNLEIYNMVGDKIYSNYGLKQQVSTQIDLSGFPRGYYFVRIFDGAGISDKKVAIQ